jgi:hypothetical protein
MATHMTQQALEPLAGRCRLNWAEQQQQQAEYDNRRTSTRHPATQSQNGAIVGLRRGGESLTECCVIPPPTLGRCSSG